MVEDTAALTWVQDMDTAIEAMATITMDVIILDMVVLDTRELLSSL